MQSTTFHLRALRTFSVLGGLIALCASSNGQLATTKTQPGESLVVPVNTPAGVVFQSNQPDAALRLTMILPDGQRYEEVFPAGGASNYLLGTGSPAGVDGLYRWELRSITPTEVSKKGSQALVQSGLLLRPGRRHPGSGAHASAGRGDHHPQR